MINASQVATYYLKKDKDKKIFNKNLINYKGTFFYEGNLKINKYLFLTQVVYIAKYGKKLFDDEFYAYENGPIIKKIMKGYKKINSNYIFDKKTKQFLDKIYYSLENATYEELIEISHEDPEYQKSLNKKMDLEKSKLYYKERYSGLIKALKL